MTEEKWILKPEMIYREEADAHGILYDTSDESVLFINNTGCIICRSLKNSCSINDIMNELYYRFFLLPVTVEEDIKEFIRILRSRGYIKTC